MTNHPHIIVVGAGIIGASIAWHLARDGARVTIIDAAEPGGAATRASWAWINASWGNPEAYFRLRIHSMAQWRRLEREVPGVDVAWTGGLLWDLPPEELDAYAREQSSWGYGIRRVDRDEALRLEPQLATPPVFALHVVEEGAVDPLAAAQALLAAAAGLGATVVSNTPVRSLNRQDARVIGVGLDSGPLTADEVIIAAGAGSPALLTTVGFRLPMSAPPGMLVVSRPRETLLNGLIMSPRLHVKQTAEGRLIAGTDFGGTAPGENPDAAAAEVFAALKDLLVDGDALELETYTIGYRPVPDDGFPAVGRIAGTGGLYVAVMHSGITLAPAIGRFVADEVLTGRRAALLAPYSPQRFLHPG